ncbi:MAG: recombinase family protein [Lachnospiraceae bacterium]
MARVSRKNNQNVSESYAKKYQVGIYVRLSVEDERKKENHSIETQKQLVIQYVEQMENADIYQIYEDVNFTGTNFKRPSFENMMEDAKKKKINCIVVKDLSRFGRNYLEAGQYMEYVFPFLNVRFISINDSYDSLNSNNSSGLILPIKNLMNEVYAKDISKKVRSGYQIKRDNGDFCGGFAPYGYIKVDNKLVVDEEVSWVVKQIFEWFADGLGDMSIAKKLNAMDLFPPKRYHYEKGIIKSDKNASLNYWHKSIIKRLLSNEVYTGDIVSGKHIKSYFSLSDKEKKDSITCSRNTHEAIITHELFDKVQKMRAIKRDYYEANLNKERSKQSTPNILKGLVYCKDCGVLMSRHKKVKVGQKLEYRYLCKTYETISAQKCNRKYLLEEKLAQGVWTAIQNQIAIFTDIEPIIKRFAKLQKITSTNKKQELFKLQKRLDELQVIASSLYGDYVDRVISKKEYLALKQQYSVETELLSCKIDDLIQKQLETTSQITNDWYSIMLQFKTSTELSVELLNALIEKIEVDSLENITITFKYKDDLKELLDDIYMQATEELGVS